MPEVDGHAAPPATGGGTQPPTAWIPAAWPAADDHAIDVVRYGPDIPTEADLRLLGHVEGKRVLVLGCAGGTAALALARQGARVVAVDESPDQVAHTRWLADRAGVKLELHRGDLADLAFLRADAVDAALSVHTIGTVDDVDRVFRQAHRVLRPEAPLVLALPHPAYRTVDPSTDPPQLRRSYFDRSPVPWETATEQGADYPLTVGDVFTRLSRANFRVDVILEPEPVPGAPRSPRWSPAMTWLPATLLLRARKLGI